MGPELQDIVTSQVYTFIMIFARLGAAVMIMPGIGDSYVPGRIRLFVALGMTVAMTPVIDPYLPDLPGPSVAFLFLVISEFVVGLFIGTIARIFMTALDTAGMVISTNMGLANAQVFNPSLAAQGSVVGAFLSITGAVLLFTTQLHHVLFLAIIDSYQSFTPGILPASGGMAEVIARSVSDAFSIGFRMATPFIVIGMMMYVIMGVLARLMPQIQVFILVLPLQIGIGLVTMVIVIPAMMLFWISAYEDAIMGFVQSAASN